MKHHFFPPRLLGTALRREGLLPEGDSLVNHLTLYEIGRLIRTRSPALMQK